MKQEAIITKNEEENSTSLLDNNKSYYKKNISLLAILILLCTSLIIATNYILNNRVINEINKTITDIEYNKVWWKDNYQLMLELQKDQMLKYVEEVTQNDPEYIEWLKRKFKTPEELKKEMILTDEEINTLKSDTYILWNTWAKLSIYEFSDFECSFCKNFHSSWSINKILEQNKNTINYVFKNVPSQKHENALILAKAWKCIFSKTNWNNYIDYINSAFKEQTIVGSGALNKIINNFADKEWIKKEEFDICINSDEIKISVEKEIWQAIYLWLKSTPSIVIVNNKDWKYYIFDWNIEEDTLSAKIEELTK